MAISPGPGRAAALDPTEGVKGWAADRASLWSQLVDLGCLRSSFLWVKICVLRAPDR
ncbi:MAG: hypothetical protein LVS60_15545 [Nodosilinea sp. LVE1205-7]